jgi:reverse gyrase
MDSAQIIITTHLSLMKKEQIQRQNVDIVFVDDVDSFLRKSKAIRFVLKMMSLPSEIKEIVENIFSQKLNFQEALFQISKIKEEKEIKAQLIVSGATQRARRTRAI